MEKDEEPLLIDEENYKEKIRCEYLKSKIPLILGFILTLLLISSLVGVISLVYFTETPKPKLEDTIEINKIMENLQFLEDIAKLHKNSRSISNGYNESANFLIRKLNEEIGTDDEYQIYKQYFNVPVFEKNKKPIIQQVSPNIIQYKYGKDFIQIDYGGNITMNETLNLIYLPFGCQLNSSRNFTDKLVMISYEKDCDIYQQSLFIQSLGAKGILFQNLLESETLMNDDLYSKHWKIDDPLVQIPVFSISFLMGESIKYNFNFQFKIYVKSIIKICETFNVICETGYKSFYNSTVIIYGAHLDSVQEGPGINDNASGSMSLLEIAIKFHNLKVKTNYPIRFIWFGAEEIGYFGSKYYVDSLLDPKSIAFYLNFDMLGSPNFMRGIHDGYTSTNFRVRRPSAKITNYFMNYFNSTLKKSSKLVPMETGSDFVPFVNHSIPSGGCKTGSSGKKSIYERELFGGIANTPYDSCYHLSCDTVSNINQEVLLDLTKSASNLLEYLIKLKDIRRFLND